MENFVRLFKSSEGDIYQISLSEDNGLLSSEVFDMLGKIHVIGIELRRLAGQNSTGHNVLAALEQTVADYFLQRDDVIVFYYCDFIKRKTTCFGQINGLLSAKRTVSRKQNNLFCFFKCISLLKQACKSFR